MKPWLICNSVAERPAPWVLSEQIACRLCAEPIWRSYSSPQDATPICRLCGQRLIDGDPYAEQLPPSRAQQADLDNFFNQSNQ